MKTGGGGVVHVNAVFRFLLLRNSFKLLQSCFQTRQLSCSVLLLVVVMMMKMKVRMLKTRVRTNGPAGNVQYFVQRDLNLH